MLDIITDLTQLETRCDEFNVPDHHDDLKKLSDDMIDLFNADKDLKSLTANQIGSELRVFALKFEDGLKFFCNPMFTIQQGIHASVETSSSLPGRQFLVARNDKVTMAFQDLFGTASSIDFDGVAGDMIQQQVQLLDGVTLADLGLEVFDDFMSASEEEQQEVIEMYMNSLQDSREQLNTEIENDPELHQRAEAIRFLTAAAKGEVQLEQPAPLSKRKQKLLAKLTKQMKHLGRNFTKKKKKRK